MIKAVIFDVDGVLVNSFEANLKFYENLFELTGYNSIPRQYYRENFHMSLEDIIQQVVGNQEDEIKRLVEIVKIRRDELYPYGLIEFPQTLSSTIKRLRQKYQLGIVTSRIRGGVFKIPQLAKLEQYFIDTVYFEDTRKHKPDPEPLLLSARRLESNPAEMVYIGDLESDLQAARSAGMKFILYSKIKLPGVDAVTSDFNLLPDLIDSLI
jgi:HAD superfamily hydrolase (TIGR01549 family)